MTYQIDNETFIFNTIIEGNPTTFVHFKGKEYKILAIAKDSETLEDYVIYQKQYDDFSFFQRKASSFFSDVDKEKYPYITQKKRFEIK